MRRTTGRASPPARTGGGSGERWRNAFAPDGSASAVVAVAVAAVGLLILRWAQGRYGFYEDEGINLLKAMMVTEGHDLYREIYSDQAPLHTELLAALMKGFGSTVATGRALALAAGVATLVLAAAIAATLAGPLAGALCAGILLSCAPFLKFSTAVLITTPATCLGLGALLCALVGGPSRRPGWWVAAGGLLGLALMTKLATVYFVPIVAAAWWWGRPAGEPTRPGLPAALWGGGSLLVVVGAVLALHAPAQAWSQLVQPHVTAWEADVRHTDTVRRLMLLAPGMPLFYGGVVLAAAATLRGQPDRRPRVVLVWLAVVVLWIVNHRPLWAHHLPDLLLPMAVALSVATSQRCARLLDRPGAAGRVGAALLALASGAVVVTQAGNHGYWRRWYNNTTEASLGTVADAIARSSSAADFVIVDRPILAFLARRRTPPALVLIAHKRIVSGGLTDEALVAALD